VRLGLDYLLLYFFWPMILDQLARGLDEIVVITLFINLFMASMREALHVCDVCSYMRGAWLPDVGCQSHWSQSFRTRHILSVIKINFYDVVLCDHNFGFNYVRLFI
jgi:hypothetical protein